MTVDLAYTMAGGRKPSPFDRRRSFAQRLQAQGMDSSPIEHPLQGVSRLAQALVGGYMGGQVDREEKAAGEQYKSALAKAMAETDPIKRQTALASLGGDGGLQAAILSTGQEAATKRKRDEDLEASSFMLGDGNGPVQAGGGRVTGAPPSHLEPLFQTASQQYGVPVPVIKAVAGVESDYNPNAVSPAGAGGVMQIMPGTAKDLGVTDRFDPAQSIPKGTAYLKQQIDKYGNLPHALAAYNWGPGNVDNWLKSGGDPARLPTETQNYIQKVQARIQGAPAGLPQGSADGSGNATPPQSFDPGAQYEAAARRAQAAGRGDIAMKYMQDATKAREQAASRDQNRTLQHVDLGDSVGILDPRTGSIVQRIPKGQKPGAEGGAFAGTGMDNQARSALVRGANDPAYAATPEYAAAYGFLSRPRFDPQTQTTIPPEDLSRFRPPSYSAQGGPPQGAPMQPNAAPPPVGGQDFTGMPPAPSPQGVQGPTMQAAPPAGGGIVATPVQGLPPKEVPMTEVQAKAYGFAQRMASANALLDDLAIQGTSTKGRFLEALPGGVGNYAQSPEFQRFEQAKRNFMNAQLRDESGAVIGPTEFMSADKQYFPQPGQATNKELLAQMAENRRQVVEAMMIKAKILKPGERYEPPKAQGDATGPNLKQKYGLE